MPMQTCGLLAVVDVLPVYVPLMEISSIITFKEKGSPNFKGVPSGVFSGIAPT